MASLYDNYSGTATPYAGNAVINATTDWAAQTFTASETYNLSRIDLYLDKGAGDDVGNVTVELFATSGGEPTGSALATGTIANADVPESPGWVTCTLAAYYSISKGTVYAIQIKAASADGSNVLYWSYDDIAPGVSDYAGGDALWSTDSGSNWTTDTTADYLFRNYGAGATPVDKLYSKKWLSIGNEEIWWESSAGTMAEIAAANGTISTVNPLTVAEAFQKVFIANGSILKVLDFATIKLATGELGAASVSVPVRTAILSGDTSGAGMVCDFVNVATGSAYVYGYQIGSTAFVSDDTVVDVDATTSVSFSLVTAPTDPPHYFDWTPYANDTTTYGSMPSSCYIVVRYRGRLVLAGHPNYPHQWYMAKIGNPWDWVYGSTDPLTAVAGNNADAGELGDIIRALIPYGDDFLVFGCANSIHILNGDPAFSGSIDEIDNTTGIFSPWSWCKDSVGNLYFYGNDGLYKMAGGRSKPVNFSKAHLPNLAKNWAVNPSTHRVVLVFDSRRNAILIIRTTLATGVNTGYWYSLETEGFYPVTFPDECGIFCGNYYNADDPDYRDTLYGSATGYILKLDDTAKNDDIGASDVAISSYVTMIEHLSEDEDKKGKVTSITFVLAGGASGGDFSDSDNLVCEFHVADDAETCLEDIKDGATAFLTIALVSAGRKPRVRTKIRGAYLGIKLINDIAGESWGINGIYADVKSIGRIQ